MKKTIVTLSCLVLSSCSIFMAANKEGASIDQVQASHTRANFLALGAKVVSSERLPSGELVETYQIPKEKGSILRAVMHGILDLSTCFIWEVAGTPIECCMDKQEYIVVKVTYDANDIAKRAELI